MKYRTKLYLYFLIIAFTSVSLALFILYYETRRQLYTEMRSKVASIAATTASMVDGDLFDKVQTPEDENKLPFKTLQQQMLKARSINRRDDIYVRYIYSIRPSKEHQGYMEVVVDSTIDPKTFAPVGQLVLSENIGEILSHLNITYSPKRITKIAYGDFLTGFSPIYDTKGKYVATLGVDIDASNIIARLNSLFYFGLISLGIAIVIALIMAYYLSRRPIQSLRKIYDATVAIKEGNLDYKLDFKTKDEFSVVGNCINDMTKGLKERERLKVNFSRYVSQHVLDRLLAEKTEAKTEGERKRITVLFSDLHEFTALTEKLDPEEVIYRLNEYFSRMLDIIFKHDGTLDKFIGDGIMVNFGSLVNDPNQEKHAILTAIEMHKALEELNIEWEKKGKEKLTMGIGIHTGDAIVGNIGSERRLEYTAIGDAVNVAARLEAETKKRTIPILVSRETYEKVKEEFQFENLGQIELPGREGKIEVFKPQ